MSTITRRGSALAALTLLLPMVGVGTAAPAAAHTELRSSSPSNGAVVESPASAKLVFNEPVRPDADGTGLKSSAGTPVPTGPVKRTGNTVVVPIKGTLKAGGYLLSYSVVSADGHPVKGTVAFRVKG